MIFSSVHVTYILAVVLDKYKPRIMLKILYVHNIVFATWDSDCNDICNMNKHIFCIEMCNINFIDHFIFWKFTVYKWFDVVLVLLWSCVYSLILISLHEFTCIQFIAHIRTIFHCGDTMLDCVLLNIYIDYRNINTF